MKGDLHLHTTWSDGSLTTAEVLTAAKERGLTHVAVTDHDTVAGQDEAVRIGDDLGLTVYRGIEISAIDPASGKKVHILGYCFRADATHIRRLCEPLLQARHEKSRSQIEALTAHGYRISYDDIAAKAMTGGVIYKQHIMAHLIEQGYTDDIYSPLYKLLFTTGGICSGDIGYVDVFAAVKAIKDDGGIAVLAHPGHQNTYDLIDSLVKVGLDGIELYHEEHTVDDHIKIMEYANRHYLLLTGGSDIHGAYGSATAPGQYGCPEETLAILDGYCQKAFLDFTKEIAAQAGQRLRLLAKQEKEVTLKGNDLSDLVTCHDQEIEQFLINAISAVYPGHSFLTEENTSQSRLVTHYTWIIDPIDGTTNFVQFGRDFAVSIALYRNGRPYVGVVYDVMAGNMYAAASGMGAWLNDQQLVKKQPSHTLSEAVVDCSLRTVQLFSEKFCIDLAGLAGYIRGHRSYGAASLAICRVAAGELSAYLSAKLYLWDYAAAVIILAELEGDYCLLSGPAATPGINREQVVFLACENSQLLTELTYIINDKLSSNY